MLLYRILQIKQNNNKNCYFLPLITIILNWLYNVKKFIKLDIANNYQQKKQLIKFIKLINNKLIEAIQAYNLLNLVIYNLIDYVL